MPSWGGGSATVVRAETPSGDGGAALPVDAGSRRRHPADDWLDQLPGKHRLTFDTMTPDRLEDAIQFAGNFIPPNKGAYGLESADLAVVIVMRHRSAPFAYNDAMWAKYGGTLARRAEFTDPKTKEAPKVNYFTPVGRPIRRPRARAQHRRLHQARRAALRSAISRRTPSRDSSRATTASPPTPPTKIVDNLIGNGRPRPCRASSQSTARRNAATRLPSQRSDSRLIADQHRQRSG